MLAEPQVAHPGEVMRRGFASATFQILSLIALVSGIAATTVCAPARASQDNVILVSTAEELESALNPQNAGRHIRLLAGDYPVTGPLAVPDGTTLEGAGIMRMENGLPVEFEPGTATTIRVVAGFEGDLLTLGNGVTLSGLRLEDLKTAADSSPQRAGNVVVVSSRAPNDTLSAEIHDCEIINPNTTSALMDGPGGHGLAVLTRNPARGDLPAPHEGAKIAVRMEKSIVRTDGGGGAVFAINFAAHGNLSVALQGNLIEGGLDLAGGVSRPDLVTGADVLLESRNNLYVRRPGMFAGHAWWVFGGSTAPLPGLAAPGASNNRLRIFSVNDRIEGFKFGIFAVAARRWLKLSGPVSDNRLELELDGTRIRTEGEGAADLVLQGALSAPESSGNQEFPVGDRNTLSVLAHNLTGSGSPRENLFANVSGPVLESNQGSDNRLEFIGGLEEFTHSNSGFLPAPPAEYFPDER